MRTIVSQGYTINYPESTIWLYDSNKLKITGSAAGFNVKIIIQNPSGEQSQLEYTTRTKSIVFLLDDNIRYLWTKTNSDWSFIVLVDDVQIHSFGARVLNGKSFLNKTHGSSDVIYLYNVNTIFDARQIEVYSPADGRLTYGNDSTSVYEGWNSVYLPSIGITQTGDYVLDLANRVSSSISAFVTADRGISPSTSDITWNYQVTAVGVTIDGGTLYEQRQIFPTKLKLHFLDLCSGDVVIQYTNADGCIRQVCGKLIEEKDEFEPTRLSNVIRSEQYRYNPTFTNNSNSKTLKIGCYEIEAGAEIGDIIFSDTLQILDINNTWRDCVLKTNSVTNYKNNGFDNLEFEIIISEL